MTEFKEKLLDRMIAIYGYEHKFVIMFADLCENWEDNAWNDKMLEIVVEAHEEHPIKKRVKKTLDFLSGLCYYNIRKRKGEQK